MWSVHAEQTRPLYPRWPEPIVQVQRMLDIEFEAEEDSQFIMRALPMQHRLFHARNIAFLPLAIKDADGRVWTSLLARDGVPGFIDSPDPSHLDIEAKIWRGDPAARVFSGPQQREGQLVAGVGVELNSRRRNKFAGLASVTRHEDILKLSVSITEALGNCPKYITARNTLPRTHAQPSVESEQLHLGVDEALPEAVIEFVHTCDTLFLSTSYQQSSTRRNDSPSHLGCNHRGGRPGFVRVQNARTLVIPDYSGNRHMSSLGNIQSDNHCGVTFTNFKTGDVLYLTGEARNCAPEEAAKIMPRSRLVTLVKVTGFTLVRDALPFREDPMQVEASPYSPPVRPLAEEQHLVSLGSDVKATLTDIVFHETAFGSTQDRDATLATFMFTATSGLKAQAGQYAVLDLTSLIGQQTYQHMSRGDEKSVNEDGVRTWTMSAIPSQSSPRTFSITVKKVPEGRISPRLFSFGSYLKSKWEQDGHKRCPPQLELTLLGVGGSFTLPTKPVPLLLIAGGVGITPFLAFLSEIVNGPAPQAPWRVDLLVSTREAEATYGLIRKALGTQGISNPASPNLQLSVHIFQSKAGAETSESDCNTTVHQGRISAQHITESVNKLTESGRVYICGPPAFERAAEELLLDAGVGADRITKESFNF